MANFSDAQEREVFGLIRNAKLRKARALVREMVQDGKSTSEIKKELKTRFAGAPWLDKLIELLPLLIELFKKLFLA